MTYRRTETLESFEDVLRELERIQNTFEYFTPEVMKLEESHAAPAKLEEGMVVFADGTDWNPGSGQGIYAYYGGAWVKL